MKKTFHKAIKVSGIFAALALLVLTGFGCKGLSAKEKAATKNVTLEFWTVFDDVETLKKLASTYTANRKYITINIRQLRQDEIYSRFVEALADDKGPDIISVNARSLGKYLTRLQPMPTTVNDTVVVVEKGKFKETTTVTTGIKAMPDVTRLKTEYLQTVYNDVVRKEKDKENIYGLPLSVDVMALYYNKDILDRAGIAEAPKNWEEFQEDVKKLTKFDKATGKIIQSGAALGTGANIPASADLLYILFAQSQVPFVLNNIAVFNQRPRNFTSGEQLPAYQILNFYTDFANKNRDTYTWNDEMPNALESFVSGQTAFFFGYSYQFPIIKSRAPQLNFAAVPMLQLSESSPVNTANYWVQVVPAKSKNSNIAWGFINYIANTDATKVYLDAIKRPAARRSFIAEQKKNPDLEPFMSQILSADSWYDGYDYEATEKALQALFSEWLVPSDDDNEQFKKREEALNRAAAKVNQTLVVPKASL